MADLTLKRITIRNWATIPQAEIEFPENGLVLVLGNNAVSEGHLDSLGAGKTNFGKALSRAVVGVPDNPINKLSRHKKGNTYVKVDSTLQSKPFTIEIGFKCPELSKTSEGIQFALEGETPTSRSHIQLTKEELSKVIRMTPALARWTVWVDGDKLRFDELSQREAIDLLMAALRQPSWTSVHKKSASVVDYFDHELQRADQAFLKAQTDKAKSVTDVEQARRALGTAQEAYRQACDTQNESITVAEQKVTQFEVKLAQAERVQKDIAKRIKKIEDEKAKEYAAFESARLETDGSLRGAREQVKLLVKIHAGKQNVRTNAERPLKRPKICPTCGQDWVMNAQQLSEAQAVVHDAKAKEDEVKQKLDEAQLLEQQLQDKLDDIDGKLRQLNVASLTRHLSKRHRKVEEIADQIARDAHNEVLNIERLKAPVDKSAVTAAETKLSLQQETYANLEHEVERLAGEVADLRASLNVIRYWHGSFGPNGVSNMVLREAIDPLNEIARRVSQRLCSGMIGVHFVTERELASGEGKDELNVIIDNVLGSPDLEMSSKGERCLSNLIIAETLAELSQTHTAIGFCWYDEVVNNLPAHVRMVVLQYLREKAERNQQLIFIVDHYPESANYADHVLLAEKTANGTSLRWT